MTAGEQGHGAGLPDDQRRALKSAIRWQIFTMCYTAVSITIVAFVLGRSQAMRTAWIEDFLSLLPQIAFLVAVPFTRRPPTISHPYGMHRSISVGHLVAGVALLAVGGILSFESASGLIAAEHPTIGTVVLFGHTVWLGWLMIAVMVPIAIGPVFFYGPAKARLAPILHNKLLYADADMAKADWQTNAATVVGVLGVGVGIWWLDGAAALFIALGIMRDGVHNTRVALLDLMDQRARSYDDSSPHPLAKQVLERVLAEEWIDDAGVRMRDEGQVFHVEVFVRPRRDEVSAEAAERLSATIEQLDWRVQDVVVGPVADIPPAADRRGE